MIHSGPRRSPAAVAAHVTSVSRQNHRPQTLSFMSGAVSVQPLCKLRSFMTDSSQQWLRMSAVATCTADSSAVAVKHVTVHEYNISNAFFIAPQGSS
jgi:hypothetical protein